jgi:glyoxalase family protein
MEKIGEIEPELNDLVDTVLLVEDGAHPTPVIDRFCFKSVYPGTRRRAFELATDGPGFGVDEEAATLGESLVLPPWLEPNRAVIKARLPQLVFPTDSRA